MAFWKTSADAKASSSAKAMEDKLADKKKTEVEEKKPSSTVKTTLRENDAKEVITQVARQQQSAEKKVVETKQVITFELDREEYAAPILDLKEILRIPEIIAIPGAPSFMKGIFNLRGQIVMVIDLEKRFALKREHPVKPRDVIIVEVGGTIFGVVVDEVTGVLQAPVTGIKPVPSLIATKIHADYLSGVIVLEELPGTELFGSAQGEKKGELTPASPKFPRGEPEQIKERLKTQTQTGRGFASSAGGPGQARILLLIDLPKMLSEEELLGFGNTVRQTVEEIKED